MTSFFHDLEDQLRTAARQRTEAPAPEKPPRRRRVARGLRAVPVLAAVAVTLAIVGGALVLLGHRSGPSPASPASGGPGNAFAALVLRTPKAQLLRELKLIAAGTRGVQASPACRVPQQRSTPRIHGTPSQELLSTLSVLRRPATAADRLPPGSLSGMGNGISVYAGAARRLATIAGTSYFVVPIREDGAPGLPSARCFVLEKAALAKALPTFPAGLRAPTRQLAQTLIAYEASQIGKPPIDAICEVTKERNGGGTSCGDTAGALRHGVFPDDDNGTFSGLVPDGVASVTLRFSAAPGGSARTVTATVHGNVYAVATGVSGRLRPGSLTVTWHAADGHVLRTESEGTRSSLKALCRQEPDACINAVLVAGATPEQSASSSSSSASATATVQSGASAPPKGASGG